MEHAQRHRETGEPSRSRFQKPGQFLHAAVMEGVPGDGAPALGGQRFTHLRVIPGSVSPAASDGFLDYSQDEARRVVMGVADQVVHGPFDDGLNLTVVR